MLGRRGQCGGGLGCGVSPVIPKCVSNSSQTEWVDKVLRCLASTASLRTPFHRKKSPPVKFPLEERNVLVTWLERSTLMFLIPRWLLTSKYLSSRGQDEIGSPLRGIPGCRHVNRATRSSLRGPAAAAEDLWLQRRLQPRVKDRDVLLGFRLLSCRVAFIASLVPGVPCSITSVPRAGTAGQAPAVQAALVEDPQHVLLRELSQGDFCHLLSLQCVWPQRSPCLG